MHVEFYVIENANEQQTYVALCSLIEKWYANGHTIAIVCSSEKNAAALDQLLWTFNDQSFVPHALFKEEHSASPVLLYSTHAAINSSVDVLINLSDMALTSTKPLKLLIEIVFPDQTMQQLARDRYKLYRDAGYPLKTIKIPVSKVSV